MIKGKLFVIEGPDGAGKSSVTRHLVDRLRLTDIPAATYAFPGNEPGTLGRLVHDLHHDPTRHGVNSVDRASMQLLHAAAHIDGIKRSIRPALERGEVVIMDRFWWSTIVYGKQFGVDSSTLDLLERMALLHWSFVTPTAAWLLLGRAFDSSDEACPESQLRRGYQRFVQSLSVDFPIQTLEPTASSYVVTDEILDKIVSLSRS